MDNRELLIQKKNKIMSFLEKLIEREINHIQKDNCHIFSITCGIQKEKTWEQKSTRGTIREMIGAGVKGKMG